MCILLFHNIHSILLHEHVQHYEIFRIFHESHVQEEVASSKLPEDLMKKKIKFSHSFFFSFSDYCDVDWLMRTLFNFNQIIGEK